MSIQLNCTIGECTQTQITKTVEQSSIWFMCWLSLPVFRSFFLQTEFNKRTNERTNECMCLCDAELFRNWCYFTSWKIWYTNKPHTHTQTHHKLDPIKLYSSFNNQHVLFFFFGIYHINHVLSHRSIAHSDVWLNHNGSIDKRYKLNGQTSIEWNIFKKTERVKRYRILQFE